MKKMKIQCKSSSHTTGDAWDTDEHEHHKIIETYHTEGPLIDKVTEKENEAEKIKDAETVDKEKTVEE